MIMLVRLTIIVLVSVGWCEELRNDCKSGGTEMLCVNGDQAAGLKMHHRSV